MVDLRDEIQLVANCNAKVMISGDSGVGKELVAQAIHRYSSRSERPFVPVNCAGLPETLLESELFGHVKGSFTGAYRDRPGKLEMAHQGTVFLDEVGEMTLRMQGLLLRFLETGELQKVGAGAIAGTVNVRVFAATNRNLRDLISEGRFREDLFYRLNVVNLIIPPLRDRRSDVPELVDHFLRCVTADGRSQLRRVSTEAMAVMVDYSWPGNVRELMNTIERMAVSVRQEQADVQHLPPEIRTGSAAPAKPRRERRRTVADQLYSSMVKDKESFWATVYPLYMNREITKSNVRDLIDKGLTEARGNYRIVVRLFNMDDADYKRFLNFLRKHHCQLPYRDYR